MPFLLHAQDEQFGLSILVQDSSGADIPGASVTLACEGHGALGGAAESNGIVAFNGLRAGACVVTAAANGFNAASRPVSLQSSMTLIFVKLTPANGKTEIIVSAGATDLQATSTMAQGTLSREQIAQIPVLNPATGFMDILTRTTPGVAADANGFGHPLGEHADTSISLDGQPITDQQAKIFSNQIDPNVIQSLTAITGAPPVQFGDKTSLVVIVETKSGLGQHPSGFVSSEYGSFGTWTENLGFSVGGKRWGNFLAVSTGGSGRFLDTPEFSPIHDHGNNTSLFDRVDWQPHDEDLLHLNLSAGRSWFQTPNSFDSAALGQDQRTQIRNVNVAMGWNHIFSPNFLLSFTPFYRHDEAQYFPSSHLEADQPAILAQNRTLTNMGFRLEGQYAKGVQTLRVGSTYWHTLLHERFSVGLTDPLYNASCLDASGTAVAALAVRDPQACAAAGFQANSAFLSRLLPYDLSRGGTLYNFNDSADIIESAFYLQDEIRIGTLILSPGLRYDIYDGLSRGRQLETRLGIGWRTPWSGTLLRASYARLYETPYNENLIFANESGQNTSTTNPFGSYRSEPVQPGTRNQFNVGFEQAFGPHATVGADYYWKFTHNAFDFDALFNTPVTFSVAWRKSKIDGLAMRVNLLEFHGLTAYSVMGHVRSRFFTPEVGGLIFNSVPSSGVFRIDHGEEFEQATNVRYQVPAHLTGRFRPWVSGVWRFNSGLALPDTVAVYTDALALTADEQSQMSLHCGGDYATPTHAIRSCSAADFGATRIRIPAFGTENDDRNPVRVTPRAIFDLSAGEDHLLHIERCSLGVHFSVINVTNRVALYNFLSTFSGTHFVPPRSYQAGIQLTF